MKLFLIVALFGLINLSESARNQIRKQANQQSINDGHKLITRALWRIFDAIMEKKNNEPLNGRMKLIEGSLNDMLTSDSKLDGKLKDMTTSLKNQNMHLEILKKEIDKIRNLESRMQKIEEWHLRLQSDDTAIPSIGAIAQPAFSSCPAPFTEVGGECIFVSTAKKLGWREARRDCSIIGGDLTSPRDLTALRNHIKKLPSASRPEYVWIGGSKSYENSWVWSTGKQSGRLVDMSQDTWNENMPEGAGDCMGLYEMADYRAYDYVCEEKDYFICQHFL